MRAAFRSRSFSTLVRFAIFVAIVGVASGRVVAQQTNPVDRKVTNPMTDTPNVNPLTQDQPVKQKTRPSQQVAGEATDELKVAQRTFFVLLYRLLVGRDTGPRLPTLLLAIGSERVRTLLGA